MLSQAKPKPWMFVPIFFCKYGLDKSYKFLCKAVINSKYEE